MNIKECREARKKKAREAARLQRTVGVEFRLFEMRGSRRELIMQFHGPIDEFWRFEKESLAGYR